MDDSVAKYEVDSDKNDGQPLLSSNHSKEFERCQNGNTGINESKAKKQINAGKILQREAPQSHSPSK